MVSLCTVAVVAAVGGDAEVGDGASSPPGTPTATGLPQYGTLAGAVCSPGEAQSFALEPAAVAPDGRGGFYASDTVHSAICHVDRTGRVTLVAGNGASGYTGDGFVASYAELYLPSGLAVTRSGDLLIADRWNHRIRKVDAVSKVISTLAGTGEAGSAGDGGPAVAAQLSFPTGVAVGRDGAVYVADSKNNRVRRVDAATGVIDTLAGTGRAGSSGDGGEASAAELDLPVSVASDLDGGVLIADARSNRIRRVDPSGVITTVAGSGGAGGFGGDGGPATQARLSQPLGVAVTDTGIAIADSGNHRVRVVDRAGTISTIAGGEAAGFAGDGGPAATALLSFPTGLAWSEDLGLLVADTNNNRVRRVAADGAIDTAAGNGLSSYSGDGGSAPDAQLYEPIGVAGTPDGGIVIADSLNHVVRRIDPDLTIHLVAGSPDRTGYEGDGGPATQATLEFPTGVATDAAGAVYIADVGNHAVRKVDGRGVITTIAGTGTAGSTGDGGPAVAAQLSGPTGLSVDRSGNVFVADAGNHRIRRIDAATGVITTVAGNGTAGAAGDGGLAVDAELNAASGVAADERQVVIADVGNHRIRVVDLTTGTITTLAGTGEIGFSSDGTLAVASRLDHPAGVALDPATGDVYVADKGNCLIRRVERSGAATGTITTVAGWTPVRGLAPVCEFGDAGAPPRFGTTLTNPTGVAIVGDDSIVVADSLSHRVRIFPARR